MMAFIFDPGERPSVAIKGSHERFPVRRIYCVGRNYAAHAREMGKDPDREPPFFFMKPADAVVANGDDVPYPPRTANFHHEIELVVALRRGGSNLRTDQAGATIFGYAVGNDLTRRDLQLEARDTGRPWETGKAFDRSAPLTAIHPVSETAVLDQAAIWLTVNGEVRQKANIRDMIWSVPEIIAELSTLFELAPGDLLFTGTPAGVGPLKPGDLVEGGIDGLEQLRHRIVG
jgi:fumarylpyruvate hydrolase